MEDAIGFLEDTGNASDLEAARRLRSMLEAGKIKEATAVTEEDKGSLASTAYGEITLYSNHVPGRVPPSGSRDRWSRAFDLAQTLTHELAHVDQGQDYVNSSKWYRTFGGADYSEVEGWGVGLSNAARWLQDYRQRLSELPARDRAETAWRLAFQVDLIDAGLKGFLKNGYLAGNDFRELRWMWGDGTILRSSEEAFQYLTEFKKAVQEIRRLALEAAAADRETVTALCDLTVVRPGEAINRNDGEECSVQVAPGHARLQLGVARNACQYTRQRREELAGSLERPKFQNFLVRGVQGFHVTDRSQDGTLAYYEIRFCFPPYAFLAQLGGVDPPERLARELLSRAQTTAVNLTTFGFGQRP